MVKSSTDPMMAPLVAEILPIGRVLMTWRPNAALTAGASSTPSAIIASAPLPFSSAGWKANFTVPRHAARTAARRRATARLMATWASCPQACITPGTVER